MDDSALTGPVLGVTRSLTGRSWQWRAGDARIGLGIAQRLELPEMLGRLLAARGVGLDDAADFLEPKLRALMPDPSRLADMEAAAEWPQRHRIHEAIQALESRFRTLVSKAAAFRRNQKEK